MMTAQSRMPTNLRKTALQGKRYDRLIVEAQKQLSITDVRPRKPDRVYISDS